jgi:hypothetical protein
MLRPHGQTPLRRFDDGFIFESLRFRSACRAYGAFVRSIPFRTRPSGNGVVGRLLLGLTKMRLAALLRGFPASPTSRHQMVERTTTAATRGVTCPPTLSSAINRRGLTSRYCR